MSHLLLSLGQTFSALGLVATKFLTDKVPLLSFLSLRFLMATIVALAVNGPKIIAGGCPSRKVSLSILGQALLTGILFNSLCFCGLQHTSVTTAGVVLSAFPAVLLGLAVLMLNESINQSKIAAMVLAVAAIVLLQIDDPTPAASAQDYNHLLGGFLLIIALFPEALFSILSKRLATTLDPGITTFWLCLFSFVLLTPCAVIFEPGALQTLGLSELGLTLAAGGCSLFYFYFWSLGLKHVPASTAALFFGIFPAVSALAGVLLLDDPFSLTDATAISLIAASIVIGTREPIRTQLTTS